MSRRIMAISVLEFRLLLRFAQNYHSLNKEPIPSFQDTKINELESCLQTPFQGFGGFSFYKGFITKAAILFYLLARNHVLANGNKRMAIQSLSYFCFINSYELHIPEENFYQLARFTVMAKEEDKDATLKVISSTIKKYLSR